MSVRVSAGIAIAFAHLIIGVSVPAAAQTAQTGQGGDFPAPAQVAKSLIDGRPWKVSSADGNSGSLTLNPDGTGSMKGPMPWALSSSWEIKGREICISVSIGGTKCLLFRQVAGGFEGWRNNKVDIKLSR